MLSILYRTGRRNGGGGRIFTCITEFAYNPTTVGSGYPSKMDALDVCRGALGLGDPSVEMVRSTGLEPAAAALAWQCSTIELRTREFLLNGAHDRNRTCVSSSAMTHSAIELRALKYLQNVLKDLLWLLRAKPPGWSRIGAHGRT